MNHVVIAAFVIASAASTFAQVSTRNLPNPGPAVQIPLRLSEADITPAASIDKVDDGTQAVTFRRIFSTDVRSQFHYWPFGVASNDIFKYDPKSNTLNLVRNKAVITSNISGVDIGIMRSTNEGKAWTFDIIKSTSDMFVGMPTFGWVNPNEGTDASKFPISIYCIKYPIPALSYGGMTLWNRTAAGEYELPLSDQERPGQGYDVQFGDLYSDNANGGLHFAGMLNPDGAQYGAYGYFNFNLVVEDYAQSPTMPAAWGLDKFRASESPSSSYNAPMLISGDNDGTLYACFNNVPGDDAENRRGVQVSKSTDNGKTWGDFNSLPQELLDEYAKTRGGDIGFQPSLTPYDGGAFIATGPNSYSFFFRYLYGIASQTQQGSLDSILGFNIVEAAYKNGTWTLNEVANLNSLSIDAVETQDSISQAIGAPAVVVRANGRGHEIQVARTADNNNLVVKYVDQNPERKNDFAAVRRFQFANGTYNEVEAYVSNFDTDLFITSRPMNSNQWTSAINCTNDNDHTYRTYIPDIVPSLEKIPVIRMIGTNTGAIPTLLPRQVFQIMYNNSAAIDFALINPSTAGVEDERRYDFRFNNVAPNPVSNTAEVTFTLDRPAAVTMEVFDMIGNKLGTVYSQFLGAGLHGVNVDAALYATGTYNLALVVDGQRTMKSFVVVR
ncbi:MAG: exo-alpha-sialidase [Candidatus Kapabacteria bacterium]|nr:exo-alpha-sialidase [Candidatus Kapabacteria bacterium]